MRKRAAATARGKCSRLGLVPLMLFSSLGISGLKLSTKGVGRRKGVGVGEKKKKRMEDQTGTGYGVSLPPLPCLAPPFPRAPLAHHLPLENL